MIITNDFKYFKPKTLNEAIGILSKFGEKAKILAGGTDLIVHLKENLIKPDIVIDIKGIEELNKVIITDTEIFIGAGITFSEIVDSEFIKERLPVLWQASGKVASIGIRNRATLTGNICSAVPSLDSAPALLIYNAEIIIQSEKKEKTVSIHDWFIAPKKTILQPDELVIGIKIKLPSQKHAGIYEKLGRYRGEDLAQAGMGILAFKDLQYRIAFCAVGPVPQRSSRIETLLNGNRITENLIQKVKELIPEEISPISDIRSSKEYRTHMIKVMFERGMKKAVEELQGGLL